jgi:excisionase family DNA binding protein
MNEKSVEDDTLYTLKEACEYLRIGRSTLYRLMANSDLKGHKVGCTWRFYLGELRSFVRGDEMVEEAEDKTEQG